MEETQQLLRSGHLLYEDIKPKVNKSQKKLCIGLIMFSILLHMTKLSLS